MKKTVIININGIVFHIDEDAYEKLQYYLDSLHHYFGDREEGKEVVSDIEARIAELLQPKINDNKQSVTIDDINEILAILGTPEDIAGSGDSVYDNEPSASTSYSSKRGSRRLYRDLENSWIGGICSGFGAYFNVDPIVFRIIFIALVFAGGVAFLIYPILWMAVPAARTSAEKLEMRGRNITLGSIEQTVRDEMKQGRANMNRSNSLWGSIRGFFSELFHFLGKLIHSIFHVLRYVFGMALIVFALGIIIALVGGLYFKNFASSDMFSEFFPTVQDFLYNIITPLHADTLLFMAFVIIVLPIAGMIYGGLKLLIQFKARDKWIILALSVAWIVIVVVFVALGFNEVNQFRSENSYTENVKLTRPISGTLVIDAATTDERSANFIEHWHNSHLFYPDESKKPKELVGVIDVDIKNAKSDQLEMEIYREARGEDRSAALKSARGIQVKYSQTDSLIRLEPFFRASNDERWKFTYSKITLYIPVGMKVYLGENLKYLLHNVENTNGMWDQWMVGKSWVMTENGLDLVSFNSTDNILIKPFGNKILNLQIRNLSDIGRGDLYDHRDNGNFGQLKLDGRKFYYGTVEFTILKTNNSEPSLEVLKTAAASSDKEATRYARNIEFTVDQNDSVLWIDPVFRFPESDRKNDQNLKAVLRLPINSRVYISRDMEPLLGALSNDIDVWEGNLVNETWVMTNNGLVKMEEVENQRN